MLCRRSIIAFLGCEHLPRKLEKTARTGSCRDLNRKIILFMQKIRSFTQKHGRNRFSTGGAGSARETGSCRVGSMKAATAGKAKQKFVDEKTRVHWGKFLLSENIFL